MLSNENMDRVVVEIGKLFDGLELDDVTTIMSIQLAMVAAQDSSTSTEAIGRLDDIRNQVEEFIETIDFDDLVQERSRSTSR